MPLFLVFLIIYIHGIYTVSGSFYSQSFTKQVASLNDEIDTEAHEVTVVGSMIVELVIHIFFELIKLINMLILRLV